MALAAQQHGHRSDAVLLLPRPISISAVGRALYVPRLGGAAAAEAAATAVGAAAGLKELASPASVAELAAGRCSARMAAVATAVPAKSAMKSLKDKLPGHHCR